MTPNSHESDKTIEFRDPENRIKSFLKKYRQKVFSDYGRWWLTTLIIVLIFLVYSSRDYIPIVFNEFEHREAETELAFYDDFKLTAFHPPKVYQGQKTTLTYAFRLPDSSIDSTYRFRVSADWGGMKFDSSEFGYPGKFQGYLQTLIKIDIQNSEQLPDSIEIMTTMIEPEIDTLGVKEVSYKISTINRPNYLFQLIAILGGISTILSVLIWPAIKRAVSFMIGFPSSSKNSE